MTRTSVLIVLLTGSLGMGIYGSLVGSPFTWFYVPLTAAYGVLVWWLDRRFTLSRSLLSVLTIAALGNLAGGVLLIGGDQLYTLPLIEPLRYDDVQHAYATGVVAWACWWLIGGATRSSRVRVVAAVFMAAGLGTIIEMAEFIGATLWETNVGGYTDSMFDLVSNLTGATIAGVLLTRHEARS